jgi:hypothetical protein
MCVHQFKVMFSSLGYNSYKHDIVHPSANNMFMFFNFVFCKIIM